MSMWKNDQPRQRSKDKWEDYLPTSSIAMSRHTSYKTERMALIHRSCADSNAAVGWLCEDILGSNHFAAEG